MKRHFITEINIEELKHLKNIKIELSKDEPKNLIITGKNGVGKTTTLEAIRSCLLNIEQSMIWSINVYKNNLDKCNKQLQKVTDEDSKIILQNKIDEYKNVLKNHNAYGFNCKVSCDIKDIETLCKGGKLIFAYFESERQTKVQVPNGVEKIKLKERYLMNDKPSNIFIKYLVDLKTQQSFARNEDDVEVVENIESWFEKFENALKDILGDESVKLKFDYKNYDFKLIQDGREPYGLNELSSGYSSIINIITDLILRMDKNRASEERNYAFDCEGIVLIDEIETHLHIELQKKILPFLTSFFPNVQFIVTTHSPFILNSIDNAVIYDLEKNIRVEDLSGYSYDGIVEGYFEVDNYSNELKEKLEEYKDLAFRSNLTDEEKARRAELRVDLKNATSDLAKELKAEFDAIEENRKKLK